MWGHAWWQSQEELCSEAQERYLVWGCGGGGSGECRPGEGVQFREEGADGRRSLTWEDFSADSHLFLENWILPSTWG